MPLGKGVNTFLGFGGEVANGTPVTADLFARIIGHTLNHAKEPFMSEAANDGWHEAVHFGPGRNEGDIVFEHHYTGLELFWHSLLGTYNYSADTPVASTYTHAFEFDPSTNSFPEGITCQPIAGVGGSLEEQYAGCHATKAVIEFANGQIVRVTFTMVGNALGQAAAPSPTFPAYLPILPSHKSVLTFNGTSITIKSGTIEIEIPREGNREHYGESYVKDAEIIDRPLGKISLECEFDSTAGSDTQDIRQMYIDETESSGFVLTHSGDVITGATDYQFAIIAENAQVVTAPITMNGKGIYTLPVEATILDGLSVTLINGTVGQVT